MITIKNFVVTIFLLWIMAIVSYLAVNPEALAVWQTLYDYRYFNDLPGACEVEKFKY